MTANELPMKTPDIPLKTVLITGCSSGIGLSLTKALLDTGWRVIATARKPGPNTELGSIKHPALTVRKLDVTSHADRQALAAEITDQPLDYLINNAGYGLLGPLEEYTEEQIRQQFEVLFMGIVFLTRDCLPALRLSKGRIINISSALGYVAMPMQSLYVAGKFALEGFSEALHYELQPHDVQVALVEPGLCETRFGKNTLHPPAGQRIPAYNQQNKNFLKLREKLNTRRNTSSTAAALQIVRLMRKRVMPLRTMIGADARAVYFARRLLPAPVFNFLMRTILRKIFEA